jgi:putative CocE/NonD family hydrolase
VRARTLPAKSPTILRFTIYNDSASDMREARRTASNGYASVTGYVRGKACGPGKAEPYVHDAEDAGHLIDWIARQSWSDGRVGMYSGSYEGFTQWAATKHMPKALKTIMTGAPVGPGIDVPMEGNIVWNFIYGWPFYAAYTKGLDTATYNDFRRFRKAQRDWYVGGSAYLDLPKIDGAPNPVWTDWVNHNAVDAYWRAMLPEGDEWARIDIPVLQTAGYYYGGPGAALYYFTQHTTHRPGAEHYLVIGPYGHIDAQRGVVSSLGDTSTMISGLERDPVARIDIVAELRYQWFDYVFKHGEKPGLLRDRVNYEVVGADTWKHAPSIAAMAERRTRLFLSSAPASRGYSLSAKRAPSDSAVTLTVDLTDRRDVDSMMAGGGVRDTAVNTSTGVEFMSAPFAHATEISGLFSGHLELITNKKDFDFTVELFAYTPKGEYLQIPPFQSRASFVRSRSRRQLLTPGHVERLDFTSIRLASLRIPAGSRIVAVIRVIKNPGQEINYGTGGDVSRETIKDAGAPVQIRLLAGSYIEVPVTRAEMARVGQ